MKKRLSAGLVLLLLCGLCCCQKVQNTSDAYLSQWLDNADLYAQETPEQLYQAALGEDTLIVYSVTTRIYQVKESFEAAYPGLTVEVYDTRANDIVTALRSNYEKQEWDCDVVICSDDDATLSSQLLPLHIVNKYVPYDIAPVLSSDANSDLLYFVGECEQLFYNCQVYDECPVTNWWELTEPQWYGKVFMNSPLRSHPAYAMLHAVIANSEEMAAAYESLYGTALEIPKGSCAGKVFFERLVENGMHFTTSSNELVELVGAPGQVHPPVAFMISSKVRRSDVGLHVAAAYGITPCDGVYAPNSVSIAGGAENVSTAKLFIRWLLGETDGTGAGLAPYTLEGTWPVRTDIKNPSPIELSHGKIWFNDKAEVTEMSSSILTFWTKLQAQAEKSAD